MSQLYFSSSSVRNKRFLSIEEVLKVIPAEDALFVLDTNVIVHFRNFFLNPLYYSTNPNKKDHYLNVKYLIEKYHEYDLRYNVAFGIQESSRSPVDFSIQESRALQTRLAIKSLFEKTTSVDIENFVKENITAEAVIINETLIASKLAVFNQSFVFKDILIISYVCVLKIALLYNEIDRNVITPFNAFMNFLDFMMEEIDAVSVVLASFAFHLFGGVTAFKLIIFEKNKSSLEQKMHKLFNGSIDLIFPNLVNNAQVLFPVPNTNHSLTPIFVTGDKRLSLLHSLCNNNISIQAEDDLIDIPQLAEIGYYEEEKFKWKESELKLFRERYKSDAIKRINSDNGEKKTATHLIPLIQKLESEVLSFI